MFVFYIMAALYLNCSLPGSGKTTLANQLEHEHNALRLCHGEWIAQNLPDPGDRKEMDRSSGQVQASQWNIAKRTLLFGANILLENGFGSGDERIYFRKEAEALVAKVELHYLEARVDELWNRLEKRNTTPPAGTYRVARDELEQWTESFEPPSDMKCLS